MPTMPTQPRTEFRFRLTQREDHSVDVWVSLQLEDPTESAPLGWLGDAGTVDLGPSVLTSDQTTRVLNHLDQVVQLITDRTRSVDSDAPTLDNERLYRFRFTPREEGTVDATVYVRIDAQTPQQSSDGFLEIGASNTTLAKLSDATAMQALELISRAMECIAPARTYGNPAASTAQLVPEDSTLDVPARPSELRLRR